MGKSDVVSANAPCTVTLALDFALRAPRILRDRYECNKALKILRKFHINCKPEASVL